MEKSEYTNEFVDVFEAEKKHIFENSSRSGPNFGLAISGGGMRSASFALGLLQALVKSDFLRLVDYMSTVSGGGYIGSSLTWWLNRCLSTGRTAGTTGSEFPLGSVGVSGSSEHQNQILNFLRTHSNYLIPSHRIDIFSMVATIVRNSLVAGLVYFGLAIIAITFFYSIFFVLRLISLPRYSTWVIWLFENGLYIRSSEYWRLLLLAGFPLITSALYVLIHIGASETNLSGRYRLSAIWHLGLLVVLSLSCFFNWTSYSVYYEFADHHVVPLSSALLLAMSIAYAFCFWWSKRNSSGWLRGSFVVVFISELICLLQLVADVLLRSDSWRIILGGTTSGINADFALVVGCLLLVTVGLFFSSSVVYSVSTLLLHLIYSRSAREERGPGVTGNSGGGDSIRYDLSTRAQGDFGAVLRTIAALGMLGTFPLLVVRVGSDAKVGVTIVGVLVGGLVLIAVARRLLRKGSPKSDLTLISGSFIFLFSFIMVAFYVADWTIEPIIEAIRQSLSYSEVIRSEEYYGVPSEEDDVFVRPMSDSPVFPRSTAVERLVLLSIVGLYCYFVGTLVSLNYAGLHRMYRDRLMELFLPDHESVKSEQWGPARNASMVLIEHVCQQPNVRPYHLLNANLILVDSLSGKYRERGGTNFIMSPLYCGSDATGWRRSSHYMRQGDTGLRLATAMAISAAAASPHAGSRRSSGTRNRVVSLAMAILNLRLGYWAPHPNPEISRKKSQVPNYLVPGVLPALDRGFLSERRRFVDLTDGGHFDNLGLYELVRRRLRFILVCDSSYDPDFEYADLTQAFERLKVDFNVQIRFKRGYGLSNLEPNRVDEEGRSVHVRVADRGFAIADIFYEQEEDGNTSNGTLFYIKPTILRGLIPEVTSYLRGNPAFPHETTANQFFHESQFEAYRELGYAIGRSASRDIAVLCRVL